MAHVGSGDKADSSQRVLKLLNTKRGNEIIALTFDSKVLAVKLNRHRFIVFLGHKIVVYDMRGMSSIHTIDLGYVTDKAICALASADEMSQTVGKNFFAYPANNKTGDVNIFDVGSIVCHCCCVRVSPPQRLVMTIKAHGNPIQFLALSRNGDRLATASDKVVVVE